MARILYFTHFICNVFSKEQLEINADQFTYDKDNKIYATGNVEIIDKELLYAEKVFVNNSSKVLSARENIKILTTMVQFQSR